MGEKDDCESEDEITLFAVSKKHTIDNKVRNSRKRARFYGDGETKNRKIVHTFEDMKLLPKMIQNLYNIGIRMPTSVQKVCIPQILMNKDVIASAETGSGKTAAFVLPICQALCEEMYGIFALVVTPTRELAMQINDQVQLLGLPLGARSALAIGGQNMVQQTLQLVKRPHFMIGTPGRVLAHLRSPEPPFVKRLRFLVLDEADRLLSTDFLSRTRHIAAGLEQAQGEWVKERNILMFSATVQNKLPQLQKYLDTYSSHEVFTFGVEDTEEAPNSLDERYVLCPKQVKMCYFIYLIKLLVPLETIEATVLEESKLLKQRKRPRDLIVVQTKSPTEQIDTAESRAAQIKRALQMIVFVSTKSMCELLGETLYQLRFSHDDVVCLHANLDQARRNAALGKFRGGLAKILIATDVAARGLDIPKVDLVLNFDFPRNPELYLHRCGRTARAGKVGRVVTIVTERDVRQQKLAAVEKHCNKKLLQLESISEQEALLLLTRSSNALIKAKSEIELRRI